MNAEQCLIEIHALLDGQIWTVETVEKIADILRSAGYQVRDFDHSDDRADEIEE